MADNTSPYLSIQGSLPFNAAGTPNPFLGAGGSPAQALAGLGPAYQTGYANALALNQANYGNILAGYQQTLGNIGSGYDQLSSSVLQGIQGTQAAQSQAIKDAYAKQSGSATQDLISRGLGNTTVQQGVQRGLTLDEQKAQTGLQNQFAQLQANYQAGLGQAGLAARQQLAQGQLGFMERVNAPYPDASLYATLAQQYGAANQAQKDRQQLSGFGFAPGGGGGGGYVPSGGGFPAFRAGGSGGGMTDTAPSGYGYNPALTAYTPPAQPSQYADADAAGFGKGYGGELAASYGPSPRYGADYAGTTPSVAATGYPTGGGFVGVDLTGTGLTDEQFEGMFG